MSVAVPAFQTQVSRDFAKAWGIDADLTFVGTGQQPDASSWWLVILDDSDQAGALGYHDYTPAGLPIGKVFAGTDLQLGFKWQITATHELLEMLADPDINLAALAPDLNQPHPLRLYAREVCDACEADQFGYDINGTPATDFVFPAWFESFRAPDSTQFDQANKIKRPFQLLKGGYIGILRLIGGEGWTQITAETEPHTYQMRPRVGSRRERRRTPRELWLKSRDFSEIQRNRKTHKHTA